MKAYIFIRLTSFFREDMKKAVESISSISGIVFADAVFGDIDIIAKAEFQSFEEIKRIIEEVYATGMVRDTDTRIVYPT
ncbi:MAG: Lrp/AsnC ligand binding domain-containing protein [candidate division WOR-3 bacterium]|nr:Lrp/AsnC ligand binding domain-containing protein [candidate division WOR-3 bacterium]MCX7947364.1 Lrp/AsnC ligand binding domain-containing protein [candidate division WOR-3 bacterium]MDW8150080.1 Lrp/AsnC ligand binding domain-containing protein [candidate division WOR-3 bacterium]